MKPKQNLYRLGVLLSLVLSLPATTDLKPPRHIIYIIGDGMGLTYLSAYRYFKSNTLSRETVVATLFDYAKRAEKAARLPVH